MDTQPTAHVAATTLGQAAAASLDRKLHDPTLAALRRAEPPPQISPRIAEALAHAAANPPPPIPAHLRAGFDRTRAPNFRFPEPHPALDPSNALKKEG